MRRAKRPVFSKDKGYADKCRALRQPIRLVGVEFSKISRNIVGFEVESLAVKSVANTNRA
jgi:hypothetical protein